MDPPTLTTAILTPVVRRVLVLPGAEVTSWTLQPIPYTIINRTTSGLYRISGTASNGAEIHSWSTVLKILQHTEADTSSPFNSSGDAAHWNYWRREVLVYTSGLLSDLPLGLAMPCWYGLHELTSETAWLWLEDIRGLAAKEWPIGRFGVAAQHLGRFQAIIAQNPAYPTFPWLSKNWLRAVMPNAEWAALDVIQSAQSWQHPLVQRFFPPQTADAVLQLWDERENFLSILEGLPRTLCHFDFWPPNLFARSLPNGSEETVLLDWSQTGIGALGEDIANLVFDSVWMCWVDGNRLEQLEQQVYKSYIAGLRESGWMGDERQVRLAYALSAALRFGLLTGLLVRRILAAEQHHEYEQQYQRPFEQIVEQKASAARQALARANEARMLLQHV